MKGSSRKYKTEKSLTNYSLCTVRQFVFSHKTILTVTEHFIITVLFYLSAIIMRLHLAS